MTFKSDVYIPPAADRKGMPLFNGALMYFPDALLAVAEHSRKGNDKHNPGQHLHWSKHKSSDHADCIARHLVDIGPDWDAIDPEFDSLHATALAWRALALLQIAIEAKRAGMKVKDYLTKLRQDADRNVGNCMNAAGYCTDKCRQKVVNGSCGCLFRGPYKLIP